MHHLINYIEVQKLSNPFYQRYLIFIEYYFFPFGYNNTLLDADYKQYKVDKLEILLKKGKITRERYKELYNKIDTSNSGKSYTLIMNLLHFSYGDLRRVKELFIKSALCKDDYLDKRYLDRNNKYKLDKIDSQFIPRAIINYNNYNE